jgi:hypothetical protein
MDQTAPLLLLARRAIVLAGFGAGVEPGIAKALVNVLLVFPFAIERRLLLRFSGGHTGADG